MDREEIQRPGFAVARRGYDQAAVDEHLRRVADELERLRAAAPAHAPLSAGTSEQVRLILEAAERSASALRDDAGQRASDHVERVQDAADAMLRRLDEMQGELGGLLEALRTSGERLADGLAALNARVGDVDRPAGDAAPAPLAAEAEAEEDFAAAAPPVPPPESKPADGGRRRARRTARVPPPPAPKEGPPSARRQATDEQPQDDDAGARIIALNMALGGSPREETAAYLAEHFTLEDPEALLDDVYARAGE